MNDIDRLQLIPLLSKGVLTVTFKGQSTLDDIILFKNAIDAQLKPKNKVRKAVFDLAQIHPILNAAGRLLDLACFYRKTRKIPIEVRMPAQIYSILQEITPAEMPAPPIRQARVRAVDVIVLPPAVEDTEQQWPSLRMLQLEDALREPKLVMSCVGKVRKVTESVVTVSLFTDSEEVVGELDRSQFPKGSMVPGMVFDYRAVVTSPGKTEISVEFALEQQPSTDDLMDLAEEIAKEVPFENV